MFQINIFDLFVILCIGTFSLVSILYLVYASYRFFDIKKHNTDAFITYLTTILKEELRQSGYSIFALISIFTLGILTQDFTDHLADSETSKNPIVTLLKNIHVLETEGELRVATLVKDEDELRGLGREIFNNKKICCDSFHLIKQQKYFCGNDANQIWKEKGKIILANNDSLEAFASYINGIYYTSKNWCYLQSDPIREELVEIQTRIDLARSLTIVSFLTFVFIMALYFTYVIREYSKGKHRFKVLLTNTKGNLQKTIVAKRVFNPLKSILFVLIVFFVSRLCYNVAENNFNERAFGYYISHFKYEKK